MGNREKRIIMSIFGMGFLGVCVAMLRIAGFGTDPFTCFIVGMANIFKSSYGIIYPIIVAILIVIVFLLDKHYIGLATVINVLLVGTIGELSFKLLNSVYAFDSMLSRVLLFIAAIIFLCYASALYISADLGVSSYDAIGLIMADRKIAQYRVCRIITDVFCTVFGALFGGVVGIGTVITAFGMGPLTQWFMEHSTNKMLRSNSNS